MKVPLEQLTLTIPHEETVIYALSHIANDGLEPGLADRAPKGFSRHLSRR